MGFRSEFKIKSTKPHYSIRGGFNSTTLSGNAFDDDLISQINLVITNWFKKLHVFVLGLRTLSLLYLPSPGFDCPFRLKKIRKEFLQNPMGVEMKVERKIFRSIENKETINLLLE